MRAIATKGGPRAWVDEVCGYAVMGVPVREIRKMEVVSVGVTAEGTGLGGSVNEMESGWALAFCSPHDRVSGVWSREKGLQICQGRKLVPGATIREAVTAAVIAGHPYVPAKIVEKVKATIAEIPSARKHPGKDPESELIAEFANRFASNLFAALQAGMETATDAAKFSWCLTFNSYSEKQRKRPVFRRVCEHLHDQLMDVRQEGGHIHIGRQPIVVPGEAVDDEEPVE